MSNRERQVQLERDIDAAYFELGHASSLDEWRGAAQRIDSLLTTLYALQDSAQGDAE